MATAKLQNDVPGPDGTATPQAIADTGAADPKAWEQIEPGRYMPRRVRGSCRGRVLG